MLVVLPYSSRDQALARANLSWICELGGVKDHSLLIVADNDLDTAAEVAIAQRCFKSVEVCPIPPNSAGWPFSQNHAWKCAVDYVAHFQLYPFIFLESDAIPLRASWLEEIEAEYLRAGKPFMGYLEYASDPIRKHMNGVGVYGDIYRYAPSLTTSPTPTDPSQIGQNHMAFDWGGKDEVVPQMHVTRLIQFRYKEEGSLLQDETLSWLNPEAAIFHTCKDVRIFDLLRRKSGAVDSGPAKSESKGVAVVPPSFNPPRRTGLTTDIFIRTYAADADWQEQCVKSIDRYATGFGKTVVDMGGGDKGYLRQQVAKLNADRLSAADFILVTDSDTLFTTPITPETFLRDGRPIWFYATRESVLAVDANTAKWFEVMERFLGVRPEHEFMRRQPFFVPRWLLQAFRQFCWQRHGKSVEDYVLAQDLFSEWNCLGFYAWTFHQEAFFWIDSNGRDCPPLVCKQFWSAHFKNSVERRQDFEAALPEINRILGVAPPPMRKVAPADGWNVIEAAPKKVMDLSAKVIADNEAEAKKQAARDRMAKARAAIGKKK